MSKNNNPLRNDAIKILNDLENNNLLFFDSFKKPSNFINKIWERDIKNWWFEKNTQNALNIFKNNYARRSNNIVNDYMKEILNDS